MLQSRQLQLFDCLFCANSPPQCRADVMLTHSS